MRLNDGRLEVCSRQGGKKTVVYALDMKDIKVYRQAVTGEMTAGKDPEITEEVGLVCQSMVQETDPSKLNPMGNPLPPTGDDTPIVLCLLLAVSALVCAAMIKAKRC